MLLGMKYLGLSILFGFVLYLVYIATGGSLLAIFVASFFGGFITASIMNRLRKNKNQNNTN